MEHSISAQDLLNFQNDFLFFQKKIIPFRQKYLNRFIAIRNKEVIASAFSIRELDKKLKEQNIDIKKIVTEYVPDEEEIMIL